MFFFFKQKTAYEMRISDWSSDVCSSDLPPVPNVEQAAAKQREFLVHGRSMPHQLAREREANVLVKVREFFQGGSELLPLNPEWDRWVIDRFSAGDLASLASLTTPGDRKSTRLNSSH